MFTCRFCSLVIPWTEAEVAARPEKQAVLDDHARRVHRNEYAEVFDMMSLVEHLLDEAPPPWRKRRAANPFAWEDDTKPQRPN